MVLMFLGRTLATLGPETAYFGSFFFNSLVSVTTFKAVWVVKFAILGCTWLPSGLKLPILVFFLVFFGMNQHY